MVFNLDFMGLKHKFKESYQKEEKINLKYIKVFTYSLMDSSSFDFAFKILSLS